MDLPRRSPPAEIAARIGLTDVTVSYVSPAARGRNPWGHEIPYGQPWRTGAHPALRLTLSKEVDIGDVNVPAGTYAVIVTPQRDVWVITLARASGAPAGELVDGGLRAGPEVASFEVPAMPAPFRERFTVLFADATQDSVVLTLEWGEVRVCVPFTLHTQQQLQEGLRELASLPASYLHAARYMLEVKHEYLLGLRYVDLALSLEPNWQALLLKSALLAAAGDQKRAKAVSAEAYELRRRSGDQPGADDRQEKLATLTLPPQRISAVVSRGSTKRPGTAETLVRASTFDTTSVPLAVPREQMRADESSDATLPLDDLTGRRVRVGSREPRNATPLSAEEIGRILQNGKQDIQTCYQQALRQDPAFTRARISTSVTIGLAGRPRKIVLEAPGGLGPIEPCLKDTIGRWAFPSSSTEYEVHFPVILRGRS